MGKTLSKVTIDGAELSDEQVADLLCEEEVISFVWTRRDGKEIPFELLADAAKIDDSAMRQYLRAVSRLSKEAEARDAQKKAEDTQKVVIEAPAITDEADAETGDEFTLDQFEMLADYADLMADIARLDAELFAPAFAGWNVPNRTTDVETLCNSSVGKSALKAVKTWYFPTSDDAAAETGTTEVPSTPATSSISEPTDEKAVTPPTS